jgi:ABC-type Fe3+-hydroxamate transport system substrate-binding protein
LRTLLLVLVTILWLPPVQAAPATIEVTDDSGRLVRLDTPAKRIITLSPHATELVYAAGAGERLVAVAPYSDFPPQAARLPAIGSLGGLDRERLLALAPDLVIAWDSGNRPADLAWLTEQRFTVYRSEPRDLEDIARNLMEIGRLAGSEPTARQAAARYRRELTAACPQPPTPRPAAFIQLAERPLLTVGAGHWLDRAIARAGLRNVYASLPPRAMAVSRESLLARSPAVTLYLAYPGVAAATAGHAIGLDPALWARPGPRLPAGIAQLCRLLSHASGPAGVRSESESQATTKLHPWLKIRKSP